MREIQRGDMVGLFYEYGPKSCVYLGLAEYIGPRAVPSGLTQAGTFDGKHIKMGSGRIIVGSGKQMAFRLLESEDIVYEQEAWYIQQPKVPRLLDNCEKTHEGDIGALRASWNSKREREMTMPLVVSGFLEVHVTFSNIQIPDDLGEDSQDEYLHQKIVTALVSAGFDEKMINIKVRELEEHRKTED